MLTAVALLAGATLATAQGQGGGMGCDGTNHSIVADDEPWYVEPFMSSGIESAPTSVASGAAFSEYVYATDKDQYHYWHECGHDTYPILPSGVHYCEYVEINSGTVYNTVLSSTDANGKRVYQTAITARSNPTSQAIWYTDKYQALDDQNPHAQLIDADTLLGQQFAHMVAVQPEE